MTKYFLVMFGGALGAVSRLIVGTFIAKWYTALFPLGTFFINVTGSFLIGVLMMLFVNRPSIDVNWRLFLVTGILGGYTTFSSFEWETFAAWKGGAPIVAFSYVLSSLIVGLLGVWIGALISNRLWPHS
jgi:fluoride exporter